MSRLSEAVDDYLATRRALGFKLENHERALRDFVAHLETSGAEAITVDAAVAWACSPADADPYWWATRLSVVRVFARWWSAFDPATEVPGTEVLPISRRSRRADPYPFTDDNVVALMAMAKTLSSPLRAATYECVIGLLAVTGMRVGEVIGLDRSDLDEDNATLTIRGAKFGKTRLVPIHATTLEALRGYGRLRRRHLPNPSTPALFVSTSGTRLIYNNVHYTWFELCRLAGIEALSARCRPRPHDLRHRFAITTLIGWQRDGEDVHARLPGLSTYLGHVSPSDTYWYLRAVPELMALAAESLDGGGER